MSFSFTNEDSQRYSTLSLRDLLDARDQFHVHLMHKANVVGTAVGKYLIRKGDPPPGAVGKDRVQVKGARKPRGKRTLENSEVRDYSWPCVLVFVSQWVEDDKFANQPGAIPATDFIPKTIYLRDGRRIPVCTVEAPLVERAVAPPSVDELRFPSSVLGGGYPVISRVQQVDHVSSIGCLVTDGHLTYALTSRHVTGEPGEVLYSVVGGEVVPVGKSSPRQLKRASFEEIYREWPGKNVFVNLDVGLIEVDDLRQWTSQIYGVGPVGPLADLSTVNLTLDIIGCPVRAYGCASGPLFGKIGALFYRFKSVGGFEYVADFLIGPRGDQPLATRPGDSGTVWVVESGDKRGLMPVAVQWGGSVFAAGPTQQFPFALATNLSNVLHHLDINLQRDRTVSSFNYWGPVGHYTIGRIACDIVEDEDLKRLMHANRLRVSFERQDIDEDITSQDANSFVPLANVPDVVWKQSRTQNFPAGRRGRENPTHYADLDEHDPQNNNQTLFDQLNAPTDLTVETFQTYYDNLGHNEPRSRGLLPFRVWQIYNVMVDAARNVSYRSFVCAAGILSHYVGDACQVLHGSYLNDGDPARPRERTVRRRDGTEDVVTEPFGKGVHTAYEGKMLNNHIDTLMGDVDNAVGNAHGLQLVSGGQEAGYAVIELMRRTRDTIDPMEVVNVFGEARENRENGAEALWARFETETRDVIADGCRVLAMLWESAWREGTQGQTIDPDRLRAAPAARLMELYSDQNFLPSVSLDEIGAHL